MRKRTLIVSLSAVAVLGAAIARASVVVNEARRRQISRSARLWAVGARRGVAYALGRARHVGADEAAKSELQQQFIIRTAQDVARELGQMKGVAMKAGQLMSFIVEALPPEAQAALATLQSDAPPMAFALAEQVVVEELGKRPNRLFREFDPVPVAAASIGQVHRATMWDGRDVAVKIQYPGVADAIGADLSNAELLYQLFSTFALKSLDVKAMVDELRARMTDELDYRLEAANQQHFAELFAGHPFVRIPAVIPELSRGRVLVSEWADGMSWADFERTASAENKATAAEVLFRFAQCSIYRHQVFNGDPHPGNYRFHPDGTVTFLDFGLVKRWSDEEVATLWPLIDPVLRGDGEGCAAMMVAAGFLAPDHGLDPEQIWTYVSAPYRPYFSDTFTFTRTYIAEALGAVLDVRGPHRPVVEKLNLPTSFVILDRVIWGLSALLGRLEATNCWRDILAEYRAEGPPATPLGHAEAAWRARRLS